MPPPRLSAPTLLPGPHIRLYVLETGEEDSARVDLAVTSPGASAPPSGSRLWVPVATVEAGEAVISRRLVPGARAWVRASSRTEAGARAGDYTPPVGLTIPHPPQLSGLTLHMDSGGVVLQWIPGGATEQVSIRYGLSPGGESVGLSAPESRPARPSAFAPPIRPAMGYLVEAQVTPMDGGRLLTTEGLLVTDSVGDPTLRATPASGVTRTVRERRLAVVGTATEPVHWLFTEDGHPVRDSGFRVILEGDVGTQHDWILTASGLPVRSNELAIVRAAP